MLVWLISSHSCLIGLAVTADVQASLLESAYLMESRSWWALQFWFMASRPLYPLDAHFKSGTCGVVVHGHASGWKRALQAAVPLLQPTSVAAAMPALTVSLPLRTGRSRISQGGALIFRF